MRKINLIFLTVLTIVMLILVAQLLPRQVVNSAKNIVEHYIPMSKIDAINIRQIITADSTNSRTIMWQSDITEATAFVEYRVKGTNQISSDMTANTEFTDDKITTYQHSVTLKNLTPDTKYEYRIGYNEKRSDWNDFATAGLGPFKAIIFPDSQSNDYSVWENTAQSAKKANPDAAFFVNIGDLVDNGEDHTQWQAWFDGLHGIIDKIPIAPILGNHETYDLNWKTRMPKAYLNLFPLPANGNPDRQNQYYSFDFGDVHFIVLNTQMLEMDQFQPDLLKTEAEWFENDIVNTNKKWKIVLMHKDVLTYANNKRNDRQSGISDIGQAFMPLFDQYGIDAVLTAHLHTYRRRGNLYNFRPDSRGPLYIITGVAGDVRYPDLWETHPFDAVIAPQPETDNYMTVEAASDTLRFTSFLPSGKQIDTVEIKK